MSAPLKERARQVKLQFSKTVFDYRRHLKTDAAAPVKVTDLGAFLSSIWSKKDD